MLSLPSFIGSRIYEATHQSFITVILASHFACMCDNMCFDYSQCFIFSGSRIQQIASVMQ